VPRAGRWYNAASVDHRDPYLGVLTVWPIIWISLNIVVVRLTAAVPLVTLSFITLLLIVALVVYYVVHAATNKKLGPGRRALWVVAIVIGNVLLMPVYWYQEIWRAG
jgi:hypothetical protein